VGHVHITAQNAIPLLAMADHYMIPSLKRSTSDYILKNVNRENALEILKR
jgi:hypothetical protein